MVEQTFGQWVRNRMYRIFDDITLAIVDPETQSLVPFPTTLVYGDPRRVEAMKGFDLDRLTDPSERMVLEAIILMLGTLPQAGIEPSDPLFAMMCDLGATFYARGFILGSLLGVDGPIDRAEMDKFLDDVVGDIDSQVAELDLDEMELEDDE